MYRLPCLALLLVVGYVSVIQQLIPAQCPDDSVAKLSTCLAEMKNISSQIAEEIPQIHLLAFPLFHFKKSHIVSICDEYKTTEACITKGNTNENGTTTFEQCHEHVVWRIVKSLFEYPCNNEGFLKEFDCIAKQLGENKDCENKMRVPQVATVQWDKCSKAPILYSCIQEKISSNCGTAALTVLAESLKSAGCDNYKEPAEVRRRPVSSPKVAEKCPADCRMLQKTYNETLAATNATHPLFVLSQEQIEESCNNSTINDCSACEDGVVKRISAICRKPEEVAKAGGCINLLQTRKPECLEYGCEEVEEFKSCARAFVLDANCRRGLPAILDLLRVC